MKKFFYLSMIMTLGLVININAQQSYYGIKNKEVRATKPLEKGESEVEAHFFIENVTGNPLLPHPPSHITSDVDLNENSGNGKYNYYVTAVYDEGESEASNKVNVRGGQLVIEKNVIIEEGTGTWCQWCPRGFYYGDSLTRANDNVFLVAVHGGDVMENTPHMEGAAIVSYPSGNFDRSIIEANPLTWFSVAQTALAVLPVAGVEVTNTFNESTNELTVDVSAFFAESVSGDYRLGAVILENGVTGPAPQYNQSNSYSGGGNGPMGGFEHLPGSVPANMIAYNHVSRQLLGGYDGEPNSLPASINAGETHNFSFDFTIPAEWDADQVYVIAWLIKPDGKIDNAAKSHYLTGSANAKPLFISNPITAAYVGNSYTYTIFAHDPDNTDIEINSTNLPGWLTLSETSRLGFIHNKATLTGTPTSAGSYNITLSISDGEYEIEQSFTIVVQGSTGSSWELIGEAGFTDGNASNQDMAIADGGTIYLLTLDGDILEVFKKEEGSDWQSMGLNQTASSDGQIELASDGTPYIAYTYNWASIIVKKFNGSAWVQVGTSPTSGVQTGLVLDSNDNPYIVCQDAGNQYEGWAYKYDGTSWLPVGGTSYSGSGVPGTWNKAIIDNEDNLYVLWGAFSYDGTAAYVSKFDGSSWSIVGDTPVGEANVYYYQTFQLDDDGNIYVAYPAGNVVQSLETFMYNGTSWSSIGSNLAGGAVGNCNMGITDSGEPIVTFLDIAYSNTISAMKYNGTGWSFVGPQGFTGTGGAYPLIDVMGSTPYVAYADAALEGKATVRAYISQAAAVINVTPMEIVFDITLISHTSQEVITIANQGTATLEISNITSNDAAFLVDVTTLSIDPGNSEYVTITFAPTLVQLYEGEITIQSNDPVNATVIVQVSGEGDDNTGMDQLTEEGFVMYPNPAKARFYMEASVDIERVQLINIAGQVVLEETTVGNKTEINTSQFNSGMYFLKVFSSNRILTRKLVIE